VIERRRAIWQRYHSGLAELASAGWVELPRNGYADRHANGHLFHVLADSMAARMALASHLKAHGIASVSHYVPLHSAPAGRKWGRCSGELKVTDAVAERLLRLPVYYGMSDSQVDAVIDAVCGFYGP
jgi:dTDP-4-amino-4,6-dideoxygalactose transaminase